MKFRGIGVRSYGKVYALFITKSGMFVEVDM